jgi:hypothetical protein
LVIEKLEPGDLERRALFCWRAAHRNGYSFGDLADSGVAEDAKSLAGFNKI